LPLLLLLELCWVGYAVATAAGCKEYARCNDVAAHLGPTHQVTVHGDLAKRSDPKLTAGPWRMQSCRGLRRSPPDPMDTTTLWYLIAGLLVLAGLAGVLLPALPGLPLVFAGMLLAAWADGFERVGGWTLAVLGVLTLLSFAADILSGAV